MTKHNEMSAFCVDDAPINSLVCTRTVSGVLIEFSFTSSKVQNP